jgi:tetratricopeptide (TPR) repeat protein
MFKNIGFIIKNVPSAAKKGEAHLNRAIESAKAIGAKGILGEAYLDLGLLYKAKGEKNKARELLSKGVEVFEHCGAEVFMKQAKEALAKIE